MNKVTLPLRISFSAPTYIVFNPKTSLRCVYRVSNIHAVDGDIIIWSNVSIGAPVLTAAMLAKALHETPATPELRAMLDTLVTAVAQEGYTFDAACFDWGHDAAVEGDHLWSEEKPLEEGRYKPGDPLYPCFKLGYSAASRGGTFQDELSRLLQQMSDLEAFSVAKSIPALHAAVDDVASADDGSDALVELMFQCAITWLALNKTKGLDDMEPSAVRACLKLANDYIPEELEAVPRKG